jgi:hypothetical protein
MELLAEVQLTEKAKNQVMMMYLLKRIPDF